MTCGCSISPTRTVTRSRSSDAQTVPCTLGILREPGHYHANYVAACRAMGISYKLVDIMRPDWLRAVQEANCDAYLVWPSGSQHVWKELYDERLKVMVGELGLLIFPTYDELWLWESKPPDVLLGDGPRSAHAGHAYLLQPRRSAGVRRDGRFARHLEDRSWRYLARSEDSAQRAARLSGTPSGHSAGESPCAAGALARKREVLSSFKSSSRMPRSGACSGSTNRISAT